MSSTDTHTLAEPSASQSWRDLYAVHPCAECYGIVSNEELQKLADDIKARGLQELIKLIRTSDPDRPFAVLDGCNRLAALALLHVEFPSDPSDYVEVPGPHKGPIFEIVKPDDPARYVIGANILRRHLTKAARVELIYRTIKAAESIDSAKVARSFNPEIGKKGGSTKDPTLTKTLEESEKVGAGKRTVERVVAKVEGRTPKSTIEPAVTLPLPPKSTYEWTDKRATELQKQRGAATKSLMEVLTGYETLLTEPEFKGAERRTARHNFKEDLRRVGARADQVFKS